MVGLLLVLLVATRHWWYADVAGTLGMSEAAWFYVFGGVQETALWLLLMPSALALKGVSRKLALLACVVGAVMGAFIGTCRVGLAYSGKTLASVPQGQGLCHAWLEVDINVPLVGAMLAAALTIMWDGYGRSRRS